MWQVAGINLAAANTLFLLSCSHKQQAVDRPSLLKNRNKQKSLARATGCCWRRCQRTASLAEYLRNVCCLPAPSSMASFSCIVVVVIIFVGHSFVQITINHRIIIFWCQPYLSNVFIILTRTHTHTHLSMIIWRKQKQRAAKVPLTVKSTLWQIVFRNVTNVK